MGSTGTTGALGTPGATGETGATGVTGQTGTTGITGLSGATDITGITGETWLTGTTGVSGTTGLIGNIGPTGITGVEGAIGITGATGTTGITGPCCVWDGNINEPLSNITNFTPVGPGTWTPSATQTSLSGIVIGTPSFLAYNIPVPQSIEVLQVDIQFPSGQPTETDVEAGLIAGWDGTNTNPVGVASVYYFHADNSAGTLANGVFRVESFGGTNQAEFSFPLAFDTYYTVRVIKFGKKTSVYIDTNNSGIFTFVGQSNFVSELVTGDRVGVWALNATPDFKNFLGWLSELPLP
jgi:hypothetical protein